MGRTARTDKSGQWDRVSRFFGEVAFRHLMNKKVAVIGLGSGGSVATLELAKAGVRRFVLVDPDTLAEHNIVRHALDLRYVGWAKVEGMRELIFHRNPNAKVAGYQSDARNVYSRLKGVDLMMICVDSEVARHSIAMKAREMGIVTVIAGAYEKAAGGDIVIIYPDHGPCYSCVASELAVPEDVQRPPVLDYGQVRSDGTLKGEPGLGMHVARIALAQADVVLRQLMANTDSPLDKVPGNVMIMANNRHIIGEEGGREVALNPGEARWFNLGSKPGCLVCQIAPQSTTVSVDELFTGGNVS